MRHSYCLVTCFKLTQIIIDYMQYKPFYFLYVLTERLDAMDRHHSFQDSVLDVILNKLEEILVAQRSRRGTARLNHVEDESFVQISNDLPCKSPEELLGLNERLIEESFKSNLVSQFISIAKPKKFSKLHYTFPFTLIFKQQ